MEKCPNCGAAVRPGAKFCTSCGTRLNETTAPASQAPAQEPPAASESTAVATPAAQPEQEPTDDRYASWGQASSGWGTPSGESTGVSSPADRFEAALDTDAAEPAPAADESSATFSASSWGQPAKADTGSDEDRFASWASAYGSYEPQDADTPDAGTTSDASDGSWEPEEPAPSTPHDVVIEEPMEDSPARQRAASLIDELRGLVWQIGVTEKADGDVNMAKVVLAGARGQSSDFSDLRRVLDDVQASPRDLDALETLVGRVDRIRELLDSHTRLLRAIDEAIDELR